jgi:hypothetical protein
LTGKQGRLLRIGYEILGMGLARASGSSEPGWATKLRSG